MQLEAKWIWNRQNDYQRYNDTIVALKLFELEDEVGQATMKITADCWYRLMINGEWVNDGPCRSWPAHYQYDVLDVTPYLNAGENEVSVFARYYGCGTFHQAPREAGLLAQLEITLISGETVAVATDDSWETSPVPAWLAGTPKISIQQGPVEYYDARLEDKLDFAPAAERYEAGGGPWQDLHPRDTALLTRQPAAFRNFHAANLVRKDRILPVCVPSFKLINPGNSSAGYFPSQAAGLATLIISEKTGKLEIIPSGYQVSVNGGGGKDNIFELRQGENLLLAFVNQPVGHQREQSLAIIGGRELELRNPLKPKHANPWVFIRLRKQAAADESEWRLGPVQPGGSFADYGNMIAKLAARITDRETFQQELGALAKCLPREEMLAENAHLEFVHREVIGPADNYIENPAALIYDSPEFTTLTPSPDGDLELVYDLGEQRIGYYDFEVIADEGVEVDIFQVEYICRQTGALQHTAGTHNGMRYITKQGVNRFTSLKRRSGRYIYITLRNQASPLRIRQVRLIESTYPVAWTGGFTSSDPRLDKVWEISARTLKLCMEDTFTDCPLYEQTLWVGDARNEALFAYAAFGATDIGRRCIRLAAQSLERFPLVGCQVPSAWDILLPAWSFLWGISVWDYYFFSGDKDFLEEVWPWVKQNLEGAKTLCIDHGLFSGPFWNMFDWAGIDDGHRTVLHNSMFIVGAIDAALRCAREQGEKKDLAWLVRLASSFWACLCPICEVARLIDNDPHLNDLSHSF